MRLSSHNPDDEYTPDPDAYTCTECGEVCLLCFEKVEAGPAWLAYTSGYSDCCEADVVPTYK